MDPVAGGPWRRRPTPADLLEDLPPSGVASLPAGDDLLRGTA